MADRRWRGGGGNGQYISNGFGTPSSVDGTYFGAVAVGSALTHTFTISNTSVGMANLIGAPLVKISGAAAADFSMVVSPTASIAAGSSTTFRVRFSPSVTATRVATVMVTSTDADASPYTFYLSGTGGTPHDIFLPLILK